MLIMFLPLQLRRDRLNRPLGFYIQRACFTTSSVSSTKRTRPSPIMAAPR
ncbi:Uncharacterised protein [Vibrio cholerae]|nr:Uncharacterised protein [Vibrio cholerae]